MQKSPAVANTQRPVLRKVVMSQSQLVKLHKSKHVFDFLALSS